MSETTTNTEQEAKQPTPEELKAMRDRMIKYYKDQIPVLKVQAEYEKLLADIDEDRTRRMTMLIRMAQMQAGPPQEDEEESSPESNLEEAPKQPAKGPRKLKTEA